MNGSANRPYVTLATDPQPTYSHDLYDELAVWLVFLPLGLFFIVIFAVSVLVISPVLLPLWVWERMQSSAVDRP